MRYCTYAMRKKKTRELRSEVRKLEFEIATLKTQLPLPVVAGSDKKLREAVADQAELLAIGRNNQLQLAKAQHVLTSTIGDFATFPLYSKIHLGKNWDSRRKILLSIKEEKLRMARDYILDRERLHAKMEERYSEDIFETNEGDWCCVRFETVQFPGVRSVEQVLDGIMSYLNNTELLISEKPGNFAVRDDCESLDGNILNSRLIATNRFGTTIETSTLIISQLVKDEVDGGFVGVIAINSVSEDELYPWTATENIRLDTAGAIVLTAKIPDKEAGSPSVEQTQMTVTMSQAVYNKMYHPAYSLPTEAEHQLYEDFTRSGEFMRAAVRRTVYNQY